MKVTYVLPGYSLQPSGGHKVVYEYATALTGLGHIVSVVHPYQTRAYAPRPAEDLVAARALWRRVLRWKNTRRARAHRWQSVDPAVNMIYLPGEPTEDHLPDGDALIATGWQTAEYVHLAPARKGVKFQHVGDLEIWSTCDSDTKKMIEAAFRLPLKKLAMSTAVAEMLREVSPSSETPQVIPLAIDHDVYRVKVQPAQRVRYRVGMPYRTAKSKGTADGLSALRYVRQYVPRLEVHLYGSYRMQHQLEPWMSYIRSPSNARVVELMNDVSVFVVPSLVEGFGLPGLEAMACGAALCSTDTGGVNDYARRGVDALISAPGDPEALARNILDLLTNGPKRLAIASAGMERAREMRWERSVGALERTLNRHLASA